MSNGDLDAIRLRIQARAEQMLRELLAPGTRPTPSPQPASEEIRPPAGNATLAIEELAVKIIRRQYWLFGSDLRFYTLLAAGLRWPGPQRNHQHLTALMTGLVGDGIATGEFKKTRCRQCGPGSSGVPEIGHEPFAVRSAQQTCSRGQGTRTGPLPRPGARMTPLFYPDGDECATTLLLPILADGSCVL